MSFFSAFGALAGDRVSLNNGCELLVEGHRGVVSYSEEVVEVRIKGGKLTVEGSALRLTEVNSEELFISGKIVGVKRE